MESWLPQGGTNLFQAIKAKCSEAEGKGQKLWRLSIGQPNGPALRSARTVASQAVLSDQETIHEYQDNGSPGVIDFAKRFVAAHLPFKCLENRNVAYLPIPGIKPMLGLIPLACNSSHEEIVVRTMTNPGYPTPADWCRYLQLDPIPLVTTPQNRFRFSIKDIKPGTNLIMMNYPANPHGQIATYGWLMELCERCVDLGIRIFNDAAYAMLAFNKKHCALAEVASLYTGLSWVEAFSASKAIGNGTGWRIGAMVGSPDFIGDIATIKGNTDSGFVAFSAAGVIHALENDKENIIRYRQAYKQRLAWLIKTLQAYGLKLAVRPQAGFFSLWLCPKEAFGQKIKSAEQFNFLMIEKTGVVGVHFHPYIRYAVVAPLEQEEWQQAIIKAFKQAHIKY
ncbi:MAG: aminotransferase class I/II-fold pyridoxal phosphate-dependent enzyme [Candidatus Parcubacteria bacterium]|nr:aminotransferase class I/II-fold pyridoxal phosphate-dependent enzyme [Candidatus Parcubacteria bacterium]